jgi:hypothetical protein
MAEVIRAEKAIKERVGIGELHGRMISASICAYQAACVCDDVFFRCHALSQRIYSKLCTSSACFYMHVFAHVPMDIHMKKNIA